MALSLTQTFTAVSPGVVASFLGTGGVSPYTYSVLPFGAGGVIDSNTGFYTPPGTVGTLPQQLFDTVQVIDSNSAVATSQILVGTPLLLVCDIIQNQMGLANGRVYLWDQKIFQPTDNGLYVAVSVPRVKPFANLLPYDNSGNSLPSVTSLAQIDLDIISRGPAARDQKELVLLALASQYSEQQQEANSFQISRLSNQFTNLSNIDGAAIPYRYHISFNLTYTVTQTVPISYFNTFSTPTLVTNP